MQPYDPTCHKTVICHSVDLPEPHGHIMAACSISCSHTPRRNEPYDCHLISSPHSYTTYKLASQTIQRLLYAVTIRPKSLYEDVRASTGHPRYVEMRWHQQNTISTNCTDKDAASPRGICQGCALGSAHQDPTS